MRQFKWKKIGRIFAPIQNKNSLSSSHASNPTALKISRNIYRIFYASRNKKKESSIFFFDFDLKNFKIEKLYNEPLITNTNKKVFSNGIIPGNIFKFKKSVYLSAMIWRNTKKKKWKGSTAILKLNKNKNKVVYVKTIFLPNPFGPESASYPFILSSKTNFKIFTGITTVEKSKKKDMTHILKSCVLNGFKNKIKNWKSEISENEKKIITSPSIIVLNKKKHMWFSYRNGGLSDKYRIGYANFFKNRWNVKLKTNCISKSKKGWDSDMIEYPNVFRHKDYLYLLYNGNKFGKTGIGLARAKI